MPEMKLFVVALVMCASILMDNVAASQSDGGGSDDDKVCIRERCALLYSEELDMLIGHCRYTEVPLYYCNRRRRSVSSTDPETKESLFAKMDANGDGKVQADEWLAVNGHSDDFNDLIKIHDNDGDGKISWEEIAPIPMELAEEQ
ncbi:uncharacterized protein [Amphiura filiformis]|uniref:uncharacterized protein n=1 Tax=Amphiura filiformis TaxID=82378 RepID=UPI003B227054